MWLVLWLAMAWAATLPEPWASMKLPLTGVTVVQATADGLYVHDPAVTTDQLRDRLRAGLLADGWTVSVAYNAGLGVEILARGELSMGLSDPRVLAPKLVPSTGAYVTMSMIYPEGTITPPWSQMTLPVAGARVDASAAGFLTLTFPSSTKDAQVAAWTAALQKDGYTVTAGMDANQYIARDGTRALTLRVTPEGTDVRVDLTVPILATPPR